MEGSKWSEIVLKLGEEKITQLVNHVLSRSYGGGCKIESSVGQAIASLDLPSRQEMDELKGRLDGLQRRIEGLVARMEELHKPAVRKKGSPRKPADPQEPLPQESME